MIIGYRICLMGFVLLPLVSIFVLNVVETSSTNETLLNPVPFFGITYEDDYTEIDERSLSNSIKIMKDSFGVFLKPRTFQEFVVVKTAYGNVRGKKEPYLGKKNTILEKSVYKFQGIPYAQPPIGLLRFQPPQPLLPWTSVRDALRMGSQCVQVGAYNVVRGNENCLFINVFTPALPEKGMPLKPTMVWIHGGGFKSGSSSIFGPDYLVPKDIVLVTFNYRLNILGFLSLENDEISGNYGLKDQVQALKWVKENIANFGGDPDKVTIFGESAGGASVQFHLLSPLSKGLFHQAIIQSGSTLDPWAFTDTPKQNAINIAQYLGYNSNDDKELYYFFMQESASSLALASNTLVNLEMDEKGSHLSLSSPSVESENSKDPFITKPPIDILLEGSFTKVPMIIGTLNAEGILAFSCVKIDDNYLQFLNNESTWAVPMNWEIDSEKEKDYLGQLIKKKYFNGEQISKRIVNDIVKFYSDTFFIIGTDQSITAYLNHSDAPIYNYEMAYEPLLSYIKAMALEKQRRFMGYKGAAHADELSLFFPIKHVSLVDSDQMVSDKFINMWTNFAKTGNPNDPSMKITWEKLNKNKRNYLEISDSGILKIKSGKVQQESMQFWESLCKSTSRKDKCIF